MQLLLVPEIIKEIDSNESIYEEWNRTIKEIIHNKEFKNIY